MEMSSNTKGSSTRQTLLNGESKKRIAVIRDFIILNRYIKENIPNVL